MKTIYPGRRLTLEPTPLMHAAISLGRGKRPQVQGILDRGLATPATSLNGRWWKLHFNGVGLRWHRDLKIAANSAIAKRGAKPDYDMIDAYLAG